MNLDADPKHWFLPFKYGRYLSSGLDPDPGYGRIQIQSCLGSGILDLDSESGSQFKGKKSRKNKKIMLLKSH